MKDSSETGLRNEVLHRHHQGESQRRITRQLDVSRWKVAEIVAGFERDRAPESPKAPIPANLERPTGKRGSKLDAWEPQLRELLQRYPNITATRMFEELAKLGYKGRYSLVRDRVRELRSRPAKPLTVRFETGPGEQAQMDWSTYEIPFTEEGRRKVNAFSYVLAYSRRQYVSFTERQDFETTIREHIQAFRHLGGPAAVCLYDNMKVVVTRWEDGQPLYNTRFLSFATHYGFKPWACQIRRPQTKGKVERHFQYIEGNLLNGRTFRSLEHLNEVARCWLSEIADRRQHGTTRKTPLELHAEELPHLLPMPNLEFDTSQVVYRHVESDGTIRYENNRYSVPWQLVGELLPVRIAERSLIVYGRHLTPVAEHRLAHGHALEPIMDPSHAPPRDHEEQLQRLRERFAELGEAGPRFLEGLLSKQRCGKHQAAQVLALLQAYPKADVLAAMARAVAYHAYGLSSLERILAHTSKPKAGWQQISESEQRALLRLTQTEPIGPRHSREYQDLINRQAEEAVLFEKSFNGRPIYEEGSESGGIGRAGDSPDQSARPDSGTSENA
jgi:transposase